MSDKSARGTVTSTNTTIGPVEVSKGERLFFTIDWTSGTHTLQFSIEKAGPFVAVEDGYTADTAKLAEGLGWYQIVGTSTPSADVHMVAR